MRKIIHIDMDCFYAASEEPLPGVDSGLAAGAPAVDYDGTSRPQGAGVDRGAHEQ